MAEPDFTIGVEEEYLLVDRETRALTAVPDAMMQACQEALGDKVSPEVRRHREGFASWEHRPVSR